MSLILDALRKLEREKDAREPAVLVVGSVPWGGTSRARRLVLGAGAALALALAVLLGWMLRRSPAAPATPAVDPPRVASPARAASPSPALAGPFGLRLPAPPPPVVTTLVAPPIRLSRPLPSAGRPRAVEATAAPAPLPPPAGFAEPSASTTVPVAVSASASEAAPAEGPAAATSGDLRLNAISQRDGRPVALINDRLLFEGDSFDGVRVLRIGEAEVELEVKGQRRVLRF